MNTTMLYVRMDLQHNRSESREMIHFLLRERKTFQTQCGKGPWGDSLVSEIPTSDSYHPIVSACYCNCPKCGYDFLYSVKSYATTIFSTCDHCSYYEYKSQWYSKMTRQLQNCLGTVFYVCSEANHKQYLEVRKARNWINRHREELNIRKHRILTENHVLSIYKEHCDNE